MYRAALLSILVAGQEPAYDEAHARVPDAVARTLVGAGVEEYTIWRTGPYVVHVLECRDRQTFETAMTTLSDLSIDEAWRSWQVLMDDYVDRFESGPDGGPALPVVWRLSDQAGAVTDT